MLDFLGFIKCTVPVHASGARAPAVFVAVPPPDGLPLQTRPAPDSTEHRREVAFYEQDAGQGCMRGRTWAVCAEFYPKLCAARGEGDEDIVEVMRTGVMRELVADGAADLGTRIRDLSLGIDVPGTEDYLDVVRLEHGPVADFHREYKFPGWCLGVVAKHDIPRGSLLCLMVGQIREYSEAYDESEMSQDDASGAGSQDDASGTGSQDDAWCREAYDYDLLHLPEDAMGPTFLECVDYGNIARCFNESDRPNAEFVHVRVNDIPMRARSFRRAGSRPARMSAYATMTSTGTTAMVLHGKAYWHRKARMGWRRSSSRTRRRRCGWWRRPGLGAAGARRIAVASMPRRRRRRRCAVRRPADAARSLFSFSILCD